MHSGFHLIIIWKLDSYGLSIADVQAVVSGAIGGSNIGETVEGLARFPINLRYPKEWRDSPQALRRMPILTQAGQQITLGTVAQVSLTEGPPMLRSENGRLSGWVYVDVRGRDLASTVRELQQRVAQRVQLDAGMTVSYSGQFEFLERANARLAWVVPATLLIIFVLLYLTFSRCCSTGSASTCRWPPAWASSPWPASRPSSG